MTKAFWTPEKKQDYLNLMEQREKKREYMRKYIKAKRDNGKYKYFKLNGKSIFLNQGKRDEEKKDKINQ